MPEPQDHYRSYISEQCDELLQRLDRVDERLAELQRMISEQKQRSEKFLDQLREQSATNRIGF